MFCRLMGMLRTPLYPSQHEVTLLIQSFNMRRTLQCEWHRASCKTATVHDVKFTV